MSRAQYVDLVWERHQKSTISYKMEENYMGQETVAHYKLKKGYQVKRK